MHLVRLVFRGLASTVALTLAVTLLVAAPARAQSTAVTGSAPANDTPSVKVGGTLFTDYTVQLQPESVDADGHTVTFNQFNVRRAYVNVTGNLSRRVAFRITPDITRETGAG